MLITALRQQIKNPERVSVFLDGKYGFSFTLNQVLTEGLKVGGELTGDEISTLKEKSSNEKLRQKAMNWVLLRPRSSRELRDYLKRSVYLNSRRAIEKDTSSDKTSSAFAIEQITVEFANRGWVDDLVFARWWIQRNSRANRSISFLRAELAQKGVDREVIKEVLEDREDDSVLTELVVKLRKKTKYQDDQKLMRYLVSKGFGYSSITDVLKLGAEDKLD